MASASSNEASTSANGISAPPSPTTSVSSLPESEASSSVSSYDPNEPFQAPLGAELDRDASIDGTSIGAGSAYEGGSSDMGVNGLRKTRLEDINQDERAVSKLEDSIK
jgi:hypothetical protein